MADGKWRMAEGRLHTAAVRFPSPVGRRRPEGADEGLGTHKGLVFLPHPAVPAAFSQGEKA